MARKALKTTAGAVRASSRRRILTPVLLCVLGLATAALFGAGQSGAQSDDYPGSDPTMTYPGTTPPTSPAPAPSPNRAPTTTSPAPTPSPTPPADPTPSRNTVVIKGTSIASYRFSPRTLRLRRGKRVRWSWKSNAPHNVVFRRPRKRSRTASQGRFTLRFRRRGTYRYVCTVHDFRGKIVVR